VPVLPAGARRSGKGVLLLVAVAACGRTGLFVLGQDREEEAGTDAGTADVLVEPSGPGDVRGQVIVHYTTDTGVEDRPADLSSVTIETYTELAQGGFARIPGTGAADGTFVVPAVPEAPFPLRLGSTVFVHPARMLVLGSNTAGRPNAKIDYSGIAFSLDLDGLSPWQPLPQWDLFQLVVLSSNAGCEALLFLNPPPQVGSTSLQNVAAQAQASPSVDAMQGDRASIAQFTSLPNTGGGYYVAQLTRLFDIPSPELSFPSPNPIRGSMQPVVADQQVTVNLDLPAFEAHFPELAPGAKPKYFTVAVSAYANTLSPARTLYPRFGDAQRLPEVGWPLVGLGVPAGTAGAFPLAFGNPFRGWSTRVEAAYQTVASITIPDPEGGTANVPLPGFFQHFASLASLADVSITPMITPPGDIRIDGADAFAGAGHVSASPTFTWTAATSLDPAFDGGTIVYELDVGPVFDMTVPSFSFVTTEARVTVPPELLTPGTAYGAGLGARAVAGQDPSNPAYDSVYVSTAPFSR
jgi:hypothetical protein